MPVFDFNQINEDIRCHHQYESMLNPTYHKHNCYEIYLFLNGNSKYYIEQNCYNLTRGSLFVIRPNELHRVMCLEGNVYERISIHISLSLLMKLSTVQTNLINCFENRPFGENNLTFLSEQQIEIYLSTYQKMHTYMSQDAFGSDALSHAYLTQLLVLVNRSFLQNEISLNNIMPQMISDTMQYIESHISEPISLQTLSNSLSLNGTYISRKFHEHTGTSILQYIIFKRLLLSKSYLLEGISVTEACYLSGFRDYSNFIRTFTKQFGISPGKYRKSIQYLD